MNRRTIVILVAVLVVLMGIRWMQQRSRESSLAEPDRVQLLSDFSFDEVSRVELRGPDSGALVLERKGAGWVVASRYGHPAQQGKVDELATELAALTGQFRSEREDVLPDYGLADSTAVSLKLFASSGEEVVHLLLGSAQPRGGGLFLCRAGSSAVYASPSRLLGTLGLWGDAREPDVRGFLDMTLWSWDKVDIEAFTLITPADRLAFVKAETDTLTGEASWTLDGALAKTSAVDQVLTTLMNLRGRDLLDPGVDHGLAEASRRVDLALAGGLRVNLLLGEGEGEDGDVPIQVQGDESVFSLYSTYPDRIFKNRDEFEN